MAFAEPLWLVWLKPEVSHNRAGWAIAPRAKEGVEAFPLQ